MAFNCFSPANDILFLYLRINEEFIPISFANALALMNGNARKKPLKS